MVVMGWQPRHVLTCGKLAIGVTGIGRGTTQLIQAPLVIVQIFGVLRVHSIHFTTG